MMLFNKHVKSAFILLQLVLNFLSSMSKFLVYTKLKGIFSLLTGKHHTAVKSVTGSKFSNQTDICMAGEEFWELKQRENNAWRKWPLQIASHAHPKRLGPEGAFNFCEVISNKGGHQKVLIQVSSYLQKEKA